MAGLDYRRKKMMQIFAIAALLLICLFVLTACNADRGTYDISEGVKEPTHFIAKFMLGLNSNIEVFGWTVIAFTVILKVVLSPLDIWQKYIARKNSKAMERMKPQLEALSEKYADDKQRYQQEQMALYKKEKYSMMGACLPTIVTLVVFIVIFAGFREMVGYQFALDYKNAHQAFETTMVAELGEGYDMLPNTEENAANYLAALDKAQDKVYEYYYGEDEVKTRGFLWIKNVFVPDNWQPAVPTYLAVTGQSGLATSKVAGIMQDEYNLVMHKVLGTGGWGNNGKWNGLLILPILSIALSLISQKLLTKSQGTPPPAPGGKGGDSMQANMKMMQYMMPVMIAVFAVMYSSAFALYMFTSSFMSIFFQVTFNLVAKLFDMRDAKKNGVVYVSKKK